MWDMGAKEFTIHFGPREWRIHPVWPGRGGGGEGFKLPVASRLVEIKSPTHCINKGPLVPVLYGEGIWGVLP